MKKISVMPSFFIATAICMMLVPVSWFFAWMIAACIHELFHIAALYLWGYRVLSVGIGASGAQIESNMQPGGRMVLCALAGPLAGFFLLLFLREFPRIALCGIVQSVGNLIPILPLDGGRVIYGVLLKIFPVKTAEKCYGFMEIGTLALLVIAAVYCTFCLKFGIVPLIMVSVFFIRKKALAKKCASEYNMDNRI